MKTLAIAAALACALVAQPVLAATRPISKIAITDACAAALKLAPGKMVETASEGVHDTD